MLGLGIVDAAALSAQAPDGRPRPVRRAVQLAAWQAVYCVGLGVVTVGATVLLPAASLPGYLGIAPLTAVAALLLALLTLGFSVRSRYAHAAGWYAAALVVLVGAFGVLTLPAVVLSVAVIVLLDRPAAKEWFRVEDTPEPLAFRNHTTRVPALLRPLARPLGAGWKTLLAEG
ncbi:hypothetical protein [Nocardia neocaledoniensis]|uniref:hypothetical protein n=1 Tax=Nocardia neocaledoniensis TaxID=236511 RepID=UPI002455A35C|nr:hypothetical protein [Nocardia neocaledoniensis]